MFFKVKIYNLASVGAKGILLSIAIYHNVTKTAIFAIAITAIIITSLLDTKIYA